MYVNSGIVTLEGCHLSGCYASGEGEAVRCFPTCVYADVWSMCVWSPPALPRLALALCVCHPARSLGRWFCGRVGVCVWVADRL